MPTDSAAPRAGPPDDIRAGPLNDEIAGPPGESAGIDARRRELRRAALARRAALTPEEHARRSHAICEHLLARFPELAGRRVGFCWPVRNEPDVRPALEAWRAAGRPGFAALLPVVVQKAAALAFREWRPGAPLTEDLHGIPAPAAGRVL
ncbi:MAG: hypothetical protein LBS70_09980, partial [Candidatus Accumulibacter sp.]|nr:hypothetical protein [Accumulibacter sp.]